MDIEWAKDGRTGELFIVQARPETVQSRQDADGARALTSSKRAGEVLVDRPQRRRDDRPRAGARVIRDARRSRRSCKRRGPRHRHDRPRLGAGDEAGGRDRHRPRRPHLPRRDRQPRAGPAGVVGTGTGDRSPVSDGQMVTVSCAEGDDGLRLRRPPADSTSQRDRPRRSAAAAHPDHDERRQPRRGLLPCRSSRTTASGWPAMEFIISDATSRSTRWPCSDSERLDDPAAQARDRRADRRLRRQGRSSSSTAGRGRRHDRRRLLPEGRDRPPQRLQDQRVRRTCSAARRYEPNEENPMLGFRGASRYYDPRYRDGFALECRAMRKVREEMGLTNVKVMVPFCRTVEEGRRVLAEMAQHGLARGEDGLEVYVMCEIPSNVDPGRRVRRGLRRLLDRLQRPDPAHARRGPRLRDRRASVRRAERRREADDRRRSSGPPTQPAARSASAARRRATTRSSPSSWSSRASTASRSIRTPSSRPMLAIVEAEKAVATPSWRS